jgi:hypothetical protein
MPIECRKAAVMGTSDRAALTSVVWFRVLVKEMLSLEVRSDTQESGDKATPDYHCFSSIQQSVMQRIG